MELILHLRRPADGRIHRSVVARFRTSCGVRKRSWTPIAHCRCISPTSCVQPTCRNARALEMPGRLPRANERMVERQRTHPITGLWGSGQ